MTEVAQENHDLFGVQQQIEQAQAPPEEETATVPANPPVDGKAELDRLVDRRQMTNRLPTPQETQQAWPMILQQAEMIARSGLTGSRGPVEETTARILAAWELGKGAMWAMRHLYAVHGRVGMSAEAMRALFYERCVGGRITVARHDNECCTIWAHRPNQEPMTVTFDMEQAKAAKVSMTADSNYSKWATDMLFARASARLARAYWPDILGGCSYTPEELAEIPAPPSPVSPKAVDAPAATTRQQRKADPPPVDTLKQKQEAAYRAWDTLAAAQFPEEQLDDEKARARNWWSYVCGVLGRECRQWSKMTPTDYDAILADCAKNQSALPPDERNL